MLVIATLERSGVIDPVIRLTKQKPNLNRAQKVDELFESLTEDVELI